jgi:hypothetical protein
MRHPPMRHPPRRHPPMRHPPMRHPPMRCTPMRHPPHGIHIYEMRAHDVHVYETHTYQMHAHQTHHRLTVTNRPRFGCDSQARTPNRKPGLRLIHTPESRAKPLCGGPLGHLRQHRVGYQSRAKLTQTPTAYPLYRTACPRPHTSPAIYSSPAVPTV